MAAKTPGTEESSHELDPEIAKLPFEEALQALESIIAQIEQGQIGLEASMAAYQRGDQLVRRCKAVLDDAEQRVKTLRIDEIPSDDAS